MGRVAVKPTCTPSIQCFQLTLITGMDESTRVLLVNKFKVSTLIARATWVSPLRRYRRVVRRAVVMHAGLTGGRGVFWTSRHTAVIYLFPLTFREQSDMSSNRKRRI